MKPRQDETLATANHRSPSRGQDRFALAVGILALGGGVLLLFRGPAPAVAPGSGNEAENLYALRGVLLAIGGLTLAWRLLPRFSDGALAAMLGGVAASFLVPFDYPWMMEAEILTKIFQLQDPSLFKRDMVLNTTNLVGGYNFFAWCFALVPPRWLPDAIYASWLICLSFLGLFYYVALKRLLRTPRPLLAAYIAAAATFAAYRWDKWGAFILGDNALVYPFFRHQTVALTLSLFCLYFFYRGRYWKAALLAGMAINFHINTGQHLLLLLGVDWLLFRRRRWGGFARFLAGAFLVSAITLIPTVWTELFAYREPDVAHPYILVAAYFRAPHHHLPSSWAPILFVRFGLLLAMFAALWIAKKPHGPLDRRWLTIVLTSLFFFGVAYVFVEIMPIDLVAKTQLARMTIFIQVVAALYLGDRIGRLAAWTPLIGRWNPKATLAAGALAILAAGLTLTERHRVADRAPTPMEQFFRMQTSKDALVLIPPIFNFDHFEQQTRRATVVNIKRMPFVGDSYVEYLRRIFHVLGKPPELTFDGAAALRKDYRRYLDMYHALSDEQLDALHERYRFDYVVWKSDKKAPKQLEKVFEGEPYDVYRFVPESAEGKAETH